MAVTLEVGSTFAEKYRIDGVLGRGGMGSVFGATNLSVGRRVAVKVMDTSNLEDDQREGLLHRFHLEARAASLINHPGIVDVLDMGETEHGEPYIVMEYLEGATLKTVQKQLGRFTPGQAVAVLDPVLDALAAAHQARVIHRDIKPANIFLCTRPKQTVKVLDFGISRFGDGSGVTQTGLAMGTPQFMAPEQVRGEKGGGAEADLYSIGALLFSLLTGRPPFEADGGELAVLARVLNDAPPKLLSVLPTAPPELAQLVDGLLVKDRARRPHDAAALREDLLALAEPDGAALWEAAATAVRLEQTRGTPRPGSGRVLSSRPGVLAGPRSSISSAGARPRSSPGLTAPSRPTRDVEADGPTTPARPSAVPKAGPAPATSNGGLVAVLVLVVVGVLGAGGYFAFVAKPPGAQVTVLSTGRPVAPTPPPTPTPTAPTPVAPPDETPEPTQAEVTLSATPPSARFVVNGEPRPCNPCTLKEAVGTRQTVRVQAKDYVTKDFELLFDKTKAQQLDLAPDPGASKRAPPPPPGKKRVLSVDENNPYQ